MADGIGESSQSRAGRLRVALAEPTLELHVGLRLGRAAADAGASGLALVERMARLTDNLIASGTTSARNGGSSRMLPSEKAGLISGGRAQMPTVGQCRDYAAKYKILGADPANSARRSTVLKAISRSWTALGNQLDSLALIVKDEG